MAGGESEPGDLVFGMHQLDVYMKINNFVRTLWKYLKYFEDDIELNQHGKGQHYNRFLFSILHPHFSPLCLYFQKVHTFQASLEAVLAQLCDAEHAQKSLTSSGTGEADPATFRNQLKTFSASLAPLQRVVEDINDQASDFTANNVALSRQILQRLEDINTR